MKDEVAVMQKMADLLEPLDGPARARVLSWAAGAATIRRVQPTMVRSTQEAGRRSQSIDEWLEEEDYC